MTMHTLFSCSICGHPTHRKNGTAEAPGFAVKLDANRVVHVDGDWERADAHVCRNCARQIGACYVSGAFGEPVLDKALIKEARRVSVG